MTADTQTVLFYEQHASDYALRTRNFGMEALYDRFLPRLPVGARILDLGCGSGRDCLAFVQRGFRPTGLDISQGLIREAALFSGVPCVQGDFAHLQFNAEFEAVWACASLLHVPKKDFNSVLQQLRRALVPEGIAYISLKDGVGEAYAADGRLFAYYAEQEVATAAAKAGLVVLEYWKSPSVVPFDAALWHNFVFGVKH